MIKDLIKKWIDTHQLSKEELAELLTESYKIEGKEVSIEQVLQLLNSGPISINIVSVISEICIHNNWTLQLLESKPNAFGQREVLQMKLIEEDETEGTNEQ